MAVYLCESETFKSLSKKVIR